MQMREHPYSDDWDDDKIMMKVDTDEYTAYCSPNVDGRIYIDGTPCRETHENNAPFRMDVLFDEIPENDQAIVEDLGEHFNERLEETASEIFEAIEEKSESDNLMDGIIETPADEIIEEVERARREE